MCYILKMQRKTPFEIDEIYHVYNRGVEKRILFQNHYEYKRFMALLYVSNSTKQIHLSNDLHNNIDEIFQKDREEQLIAIGAYCLMPNHFHLLLTPLVDGGISKFMQKLQTGYSMYFNKKHSRVGALFQGVFKSKHINKNEYLMHIYSYIHLNPAKLKNTEWKIQPKGFISELKEFISEYPYSSLQEYNSSNYKILNPKPFPINKKDVCNYSQMIDDYTEAFVPPENNSKKNKYTKHKYGLALKNP